MLASIESELREESRLISRTLRSKLDALPQDSVLIGAGDSYAAALCVSYISPAGSIALDPYELITSPQLARSRTVVFLSASGRTRSNVAAARRVRSTAAETIAITADESSPLARAVGRTIPLPYDYRPRMPGMASFALMLATSVKLLAPNLRANPTRAFAAARGISLSLGFSRKGVTFFLGNRALYAVSIYAAAKLYEFFGATAACQRLEEFSHMELFSLRRQDTVNIYEGFDPLKLESRLAKSLGKAGYDSHTAATGMPNALETVLTAVFATQLAVLRWARGMGRTKPYISYAREKLMISDSMIY